MTEISHFVDDVEELLETNLLGRPIRYYRKLGSTNTAAASWAKEGGPPGAVVIADEQTAGRGRHGRSWHSEPGLALTFSVLLRPVITPERWGLLTLAACVAVTDVLNDLSLNPAIKWPNDVLLDGKKCCGMLLETNSDGNRKPEAIILGIGLNVNQEEFPPDLNATSLKLELARPIDRAPLLAQLLLRLEQRLESVGQDDGSDVRRQYLERLDGLKKPMVIRVPAAGAQFEGILEDITENGALQLRTQEDIRIFHAGEVTTRA